MKRIGLLAASIAVVGLLGVGVLAYGADEGPGPEQGRLDVDGSATVAHADGTTETVTRTATVDFGDVVTVEEGTATLVLAGGQEYGLRAAPVGTRLEVAAAPRLLAGDALVVGGFPAQIRYDTTTLSAQGALKVVSGVPAAVAYAGRTRIDGAGELDEVLGLRQVVITSSAVPEPIAYDGSDGWDRRYLGAAIAFGERLEALARGYTAGLAPGGGRSVSFFESVLPALDQEPEFADDLLGERDAGENLVGAAIAVQGRDGTFRERWAEVFAFRDAGAAWGIVALDQGVSSAPLLETLELAVTAPTTSPAPPSSTSSSTTSPPTTPPTTGEQPPTTPPPTTSPDPTSPPSTGLLDPVLDPVAEILDELLSVLGLG